MPKPKKAPKAGLLEKRRRLNKLATERAMKSQQMKAFESAFKLMSAKHQKKVKRSIIRDERKALTKQAKGIRQIIRASKKKK